MKMRELYDGPRDLAQLANIDVSYDMGHLTERRERRRILRRRQLRTALAFPAVLGLVVIGTQVFQSGMGSAAIVIGGMILVIPYLSTWNIRL